MRVIVWVWGIEARASRYGRGLLGVLLGRGFSLLAGPILVASLLASWGGEICFSSFPFSLRHFLALSIGFSLWALHGPRCVLGAQEF